LTDWYFKSFPATENHQKTSAATPLDINIDTEGSDPAPGHQFLKPSEISSEGFLFRAHDVSAAA
jgi:hypothetical protein